MKKLILIGLICVLMAGAVGAELGEELVICGDFQCCTSLFECHGNWTPLLSFTWFVSISSDSKLQSISSSVSETFKNVSQILPTLQAGTTYNLEFGTRRSLADPLADVNLTVYLGQVATEIISTDGTFQFEITPLTDVNITLEAYMGKHTGITVNTLFIDNVSVREIIPDIDVYEFNPRVTKNGETILAYEMVFKVKKVDWLIRALNWIARVIG